MSQNWDALSDDEFAFAAEQELVRLEQERKRQAEELANLPDSHRLYARGYGVVTLGEVRRSRHEQPAEPTIQEPARRPSFVYLIEAVGAGRVKIGVTMHVEKRLAGLQTGSAHELVVVGQWPGGEDKERELHERFAAHRLHGEWFDACVIEDVCGFMNRRRMFW